MPDKYPEGHERIGGRLHDAAQERDRRAAAGPSRQSARDLRRSDDDRLLLVASDRLSAFDVVFDQPIPDKGRVLTGLSAWWFRRLASLGPTHFISSDLGGPASALPDRRSSSGRVDARTPRRADRRRMRGARLPGRIRLGGVPPRWRGRSGIGFRPACGRQIGFRSRSSRPRPRRRSATTRTSPASSWPSMVGAELAAELEERSLALYRAGAERAAEVGLILADTKFEFGWIDGEVALIDEVLTPDSSRFWDVGAVPARAPRRRASTSSTSATSSRHRAGTRSHPRPSLPRRGDRRDPRALRDRLRAADRGAVAGPRRHRPSAMAGGGPRPAAAGDRRPGGPDHRRRRCSALGFTTVERGALRQAAAHQPSTADDHAAAERAVADMCRRLLANPVMETADWELRVEAEHGTRARPRERSRPAGGGGGLSRDLERA